MITRMLVVCVVLVSGCSVPDVSTDAGVIGTVVQTDTTCPVARCYPYTCGAGPSGSVACVENPWANQACRIECGANNAHCPLIIPKSSCDSQCDWIPDSTQRQNCFISCYSSFSTECVLGLEP